MSSNTRPRTTRDVDSMAVIATWMRRVGLPLAILAWTGVALLAYALAPAVNFLERVMPRFLAILIVYLIVLGAEVNAFVKGVRDTPNDLVTMVHMMLRHLPTSEQAVQQGGESRKLSPDSHD